MIHDEDRAALIRAIATREGTARELAKWYGCTVAELRAFTTDNRIEIEEAKAAIDEYTVTHEESAFPSPQQLDDLWISKKFERIRRLQVTADLLYGEIEAGARDATTLREFRAYLASVANELGQLLHRGSGENADGDVLDVRIEGIDMETLK